MSEQLKAAQETYAAYVAELEATTHETAALFGISGLTTTVRPGAGWYTAPTNEGVLLNIDPLQVAHRLDGDDSEAELTVEEKIEALTHTERKHTDYAICHELGHVRDFVDPTHKDEPRTKSDNFFWNVVDDAIINKRLRRIPALDSCTDELYHEVLFPADDLRDQPKHLQLMYGLLLDTVTGQLPMLCDEAQQIIDDLKIQQSGGSTHDIMQVLANSSTTLKERRQIAEQYIKPHFDALLEEDHNNNQDNDSVHEQGENGDDGQDGGQNQNEKSPYDDAYDEYEHVMHGGHGHNGEDHEDAQDQTGSSNDNGEEEGAADADGDEGQDAEKESGDEGSEQQPSGAASMHEAIQQAGDILKAKVEAQVEADQAQEAPEAEVKQSGSRGAKGIMKELKLPPAEAETYLRELNTHRGAIRAVARAFESLAIPSDTLASPRFSNKARYAGHQIHRRRLAHAAIQLQTGSEQAIWRPVEQRGRQQDLSLDGLDVHLIGDISMSMRGDKAEQTGVTALMLMEGLELARYNIAKRSSRKKKPDARLQTIAFADTHKVVTPLTASPGLEQRGQTFSVLSGESEWGTNVAGALEEVYSAAQEHPNRNQLVFIISDGEFFDQDEALAVVSKLPSHKTHIVQLIIDTPDADPITKHLAHITDPKELPQAVRVHLREYMKSIVAH